MSHHYSRSFFVASVIRKLSEFSANFEKRTVCIADLDDDAIVNLSWQWCKLLNTEVTSAGICRFVTSAFEECPRHLGSRTLVFGVRRSEQFRRDEGNSK